MSLETCRHGIPLPSELDAVGLPNLGCIQCDLAALVLVESVEWSDEEPVDP